MSYPDRLAVARDALLHLMKDLQKILQEGIQAVLVCPHWPTVLWWPVLVDMLVEPLLIATCSSILFSCFTSRIRIFEVGAHVFYMYIYYHVWCVGSFRVGPCGEADRGLVQPYLRLIGVLLYIIYSWSDYSTLGLLPGGIPFLYDWFLLFRTLPYLGDQMKPGIKPQSKVLHTPVPCMGRETQANLPVLHCSEQHILDDAFLHW